MCTEMVYNDEDDLLVFEGVLPLNACGLDYVSSTQRTKTP